MTTRERRERMAERLEGWAAAREAKAAQAFKAREPYVGDTAFWTQPGRIIARENVYKAMDRGVEHANKAASMTSRAAGIKSQLDHSIYSDDEDAIERLEERIASLEAQRDAQKTTNAAYRKEHRAELKAMTAYGRSQSVPFPSYAVTNLGADIRRNQKRLDEARLLATDPDRVSRVVQARRDGKCQRCGEPIEVGAYIGKYADGWSHVEGTPWARCEPAS